MFLLNLFLRKFGYIVYTHIYIFWTITKDLYCKTHTLNYELYCCFCVIRLILLPHIKLLKPFLIKNMSDQFLRFFWFQRKDVRIKYFLTEFKPWNRKFDRSPGVHYPLWIHFICKKNTIIHFHPAGTWDGKKTPIGAKHNTWHLFW